MAPCGARWPFLWDGSRLPPLATNPDDAPEKGGKSLSSLFGFAPGGACRAADVAVGAVRSCRTLSPLPLENQRRFAFCGAFPGVAPAGRYPAPCFRGARTFLPLAGAAVRPSGAPGEWRQTPLPSSAAQRGGPHPARHPCASGSPGLAGATRSHAGVGLSSGSSMRVIVGDPRTGPILAPRAQFLPNAAGR